MSRILIVGGTRSPFPDVKRSLLRAGHEVMEAANTELMWATLLHYPADVIILDLPDSSRQYVAPLLREYFPEMQLLMPHAAGVAECSIDGQELRPIDSSDTSTELVRLAEDLESLRERKRHEKIACAAHHRMPNPLSSIFEGKPA